MTWSDRFLFLFLVLCLPSVLIVLPIYLLSGGLTGFARGPLERCFEGVSIHDSQQPGDVYVAYHSYRGFLVWFVQQEHQFYATPEDAKQVIAKLLQFNLTWGLLSYGALFIPFLAVGNHYAQLKSIQNQQA